MDVTQKASVLSMCLSMFRYHCFLHSASLKYLRFLPGGWAQGDSGWRKRKGGERRKEKEEEIRLEKDEKKKKKGRRAG